MFEQLQLKLLTAERRVLDTSWHFEDMSDPFSRIYYVTDGEGVLRIHGEGGQGEQVIPLLPGSLYLIPAYTRCSFWTDATVTISYVHLQLLIEGFLPFFDSVPFRFERIPDTSEEIEGTFDLLISTLSAQGPPPAPASLLRCQGSLYLMASRFCAAEGSGRMISRREIPGWLIEVAGYIRDHIETKLTVQGVADTFGYDRSYLSRMFSSCLHQPISRFIRERRIERAVELLLSGEPQKSAAQALGYADVFHFSRQFKQVTGLSPGAYISSVSSG